MLQRLTTKEPTDDMLEVAIAAFKTVQAMDEDPTIKEQKFDVKKTLKKVKEEFDEKLKKVNADSSESEWILSIAMGITRSQLQSESHIKQSQLDKANEILEKRLTGMPLWKVVGNTDFCLGDVWNGVQKKDVVNQFKHCNVYAKEECKNCFARFYCSGGCAANAYNFHGSITDVYEGGCELQRKRIECAIMIKAALADMQEEGDMKK